MSSPSDRPDTPGGGSPTPGAPSGQPSADVYTEILASKEFQELRSRYRRFVFPVTGGALAFYFTYVLLAAYSPGFMGEVITGSITVGLVFGLLQFVMVFAITTFYVRFARTVLDPAAAQIRDHHERSGAGA
ncbi:MAG: DUF485 domain-containing protein [Solirubrobacteraceae bacterium]|nr:DUF485 domain-containing protein [Solirubrobacteraceae bacterium]